MYITYVDYSTLDWLECRFSSLYLNTPFATILENTIYCILYNMFFLYKLARSSIF